MQMELEVVIVFFIYFDLFIYIPKLSQGVNAKSQYASAKSLSISADSLSCIVI